MWIVLIICYIGNKSMLISLIPKYHLVWILKTHLAFGSQDYQLDSSPHFWNLDFIIYNFYVTRFFLLPLYSVLSLYIFLHFESTPFVIALWYWFIISGIYVILLNTFSNLNKIMFISTSWLLTIYITADESVFNETCSSLTVWYHCFRQLIVSW